MERASSTSRQTNPPGNMGAAPGRALSVVQNIDFRSPDDIDDRQTPFQSEVGIEFRARFDTQANHCAP